jgi:hypothetical protein
MTINAHKDIRSQLRDAMFSLGQEYGVRGDDVPTQELSIGKLRRRGVPRSPDRRHRLTLLQDKEGVLFWEDGLIWPEAVVPGRKRGLYRSGIHGKVIDHVVVEELEPSKVGKALEAADKLLTPSQGFRLWKDGALQPPDPAANPVAKGRILLIVHGTFSQSQAIIDQWSAPKNSTGQQLLRNLSNRSAREFAYNEVWAFDHPTMSVSPMLNALDLARFFNSSQADIDIICHSRGGLVARWWLEAFDRSGAKRRVIFVGSPLDGTSLAAPNRLKYVLSWFSNLGKVLAAGASLVPFMQVVACLLRFTSVATSVAAKTPLVDAAIAMIPGLAAMSRTTNNFELSRLNAGIKTDHPYFVIKSQFEPAPIGWQFWKYFVGVDRVAMKIFPRENDLVVDSAAMDIFCQKAPPAACHDFGSSSTVYHTNYFLQRETSDKIAEWFKLN